MSFASMRIMSARMSLSEKTAAKRSAGFACAHAGSTHPAASAAAALSAGRRSTLRFMFHFSFREVDRARRLEAPAVARHCEAEAEVHQRREEIRLDAEAGPFRIGQRHLDGREKVEQADDQHQRSILEE